MQTGEPPDDDLVRAAQGGDRRSLDALLRRYVDRIHALCRRITGSDADAADASQEALIAIVRGLPRFDGRSAFSTWAYRVATNACLDELRRRGRRPAPADDEGLEAGGHALSGGPPGGGIDSVADRVDVDAALRQLAPDFRAAVVLRDLIGLDYAEIATILHLQPGTVKSRIARGRAALADILDGNPPVAPERPTSRP